MTSLIVGLRNPGSKYEGSRHNIGGDVVSALAERLGGGFRKAPRFMRADVAEVGVGPDRLRLAVPRTFMNESGAAVGPLVRYYDVDLDRLLIVHDDIDLPFAKLRMQEGRSAGGNNGIKSIISHLGTNGFWRLKVGVGRPPGRQDPAAFVLKPFAAAERDEMALTSQLAADVIEIFAREGGDVARQRAGELNQSSD